MYHSVYQNNKNKKVIQMILNVICMLICRRLPDGIVPFSTSDLARKIKLVALPKGLGFEPTPPSTDKAKKDPNVGLTLIESFKTGPLSEVEFNTGEQAVVRVMIKHKKLTPSEIAEEDRRLEEKASMGSIQSDATARGEIRGTERWSELK